MCIVILFVAGNVSVLIFILSHCVKCDFISLNPINSYTQNGLLHMLDRNKRIKPRPERFQTSNDKFDILVTCEERVYDQVMEGISNIVMLQDNT